MSRLFETVVLVDADFFFLLPGACGVTTVGGNVMTKLNRFCPFAKVFSREYEPYFEFAKVFSAKFVPKIAKRESFCQIFRVFFDTRKLMPAKVSAPKVETNYFSACEIKT